MRVRLVRHGLTRPTGRPTGLVRAARRLAAAAAALAAGAALAGEITGTEQSSRLYTKPDLTSGGGIRGTVQYPDRDLRMAFAVNSHNSDFVYRGTVSGRTFSFAGLPVGKYDLVLVYADGFYEGITLAREESRLQDADRAGIEKAIMGAIQFFDAKKIHRVEGTGGKDGVAQAVIEEIRTKPVTLQDASVRTDFRPKSVKIARVEEIGVGWQLTHTREILRIEVGKQERQGFFDHEFRPELQGIRVAGAMKDVGTLNFRGKPLPK